MTSFNSTVPYSEGEVKKLLGYVRHITSVGGDYGFSACVVGKSSIAVSHRVFLTILLRPLDEFHQYVAIRVR